MGVEQIRGCHGLELGGNLTPKGHTGIFRMGVGGGNETILHLNCGDYMSIYQNS